jgi:hypothetical protein
MQKTLLSTALLAAILNLQADETTTDTTINKVRPGASADYIGASLLSPTQRTFEQSKYIPDISLVMDASYVHRDADQDQLSHYEVPGIAHGLLGSHSDGGVTHATYNANEGFNLNYAELVLSSSVDPFFAMQGVFHLSEHGLEIEEAYFTSTALENGLRFKGGKFNSNFGYLNQQHHHVWDFADMPLVYESFLGMHGINEIGAQLQWTAPTPFYLMAGVEVLQGENEQMFGNGSIGYNEEDNSAIAKHAQAPSLYLGYIKSSFDIGDTTLLAGLSYARGASRIDHSSDDENPHAFSGMSSLYGADFLVKHYFDSYSSLKWQSEYLYRRMDGTQHGGIDYTTDPYTYSSTPIAKRQGGFYTQLVYMYNANWGAGLRYDAITLNKISTSPNVATDMNKYSAMVEYHSSEFARFRLQYNRNNALYNEDGVQQHIDTIILQANIAIGAHAAHSF